MGPHWRPACTWKVDLMQPFSNWHRALAKGLHFCEKRNRTRFFNLAEGRGTNQPRKHPHKRMPRVHVIVFCRAVCSTLRSIQKWFLIHSIAPSKPSNFDNATHWLRYILWSLRVKVYGLKSCHPAAFCAASARHMLHKTNSCYVDLTY